MTRAAGAPGTAGVGYRGLADVTDPRFTPDQLAHLAAFEDAPTPPEVREATVVEEVARAISARTTCDGQPWPNDFHRELAVAAIAAYRARARLSATSAMRIHRGIRAALAPQAGDQR